MEYGQVELIPIKTHIVTKRDNIADVIEKYAGPFMGPDDVVSVAESVVAITQGRYRRPEQMNPSMLAHVLARFVHPDSSCSSACGMQLTIDEGGALREDGGVGRGDVRVGAEDGGGASVEVPAHGLFFRGGFGVDFDEGGVGEAGTHGLG